MIARGITPPEVPKNKPKLTDLLKPSSDLEEDDVSDDEEHPISEIKSDKKAEEADKQTVSRMNSKDKIANLIEHGYSLVGQCNAKIEFIDEVLSKRIEDLTGSRSKTMAAVNAAIQAKREALKTLSQSLLIQMSKTCEQAMCDEAQNVRRITTLTNLIHDVENQIQSFPAITLQNLRAKNTSAEPRYGQLAATITGSLCKIEKHNITRIIMTEAQANQAFHASTAAAHRGDQASQQINYATVQVSDAELARIMPQGKK